MLGISRRRCLLASIIVFSSLLGSVQAQTPTQTWSQAPTCSNGLPTPSAQNGTYSDHYGASWAVQCGQDSTGFAYDIAGTTGQGMYACFKGCDSRPGCTAFMYTGTVTGANPPQGSGKCYYKQQTGSYYTNSTVYGAANLISNGTPQLACPYYNGTTFTASDNSVWQIMCGFGVTASSASTSNGASGSMAQCMTQCNAISDCTLFSFTYTLAEPADTAQNNDGQCSYRKGTYTITGGGTATSAVAIRIGTATSSSSSTVVSVSSSVANPSSTSTFTTPSSGSSTAVSASSTSLASSLASSSAASACTAAPSPSVPACPGSSGQAFIDSCGTNYTVYCGQDCGPSSVSSPQAYNLTQCMQLCDAYINCQAATFAPGNPGTCYLKTGFTSLSSNTGVNTIVRYIPPNPAFAIPVLAPSVNTSSGCGTALPAGLTPDGSSVLFNFLNPSDGLNRNYTIHIPKYYDINHASPIIFAFPGNGEAAANIEAETGMSNRVTNPYAIAVYVNGYALGFASNPSWGVPGKQYGFVDDIGFMKALIANLTASFCVDTGRIFATGHSNGGGFVNVLACDPVLSNSIAVFTANSAACYTNNTSGDPATIEPLNTPVQALCSPSRPVPFLEIHGTADGTIKYYGDLRNGKIVPTIPHLLTDWSVRNGLSAQNLTTYPGNSITEYQFGSGSSLGFVTQYTLSGWTHAWASVSSNAPMDATPVMMNFFYTWSNYSTAASSISSASSSTLTSSSVSSVSLSTASSSTLPTSSTTSSTSPTSSSSTVSTSSTLQAISVAASTTINSSSSTLQSTSVTPVPTSSTSSSPSLTSLLTSPTSITASSSTTSTASSIILTTNTIPNGGSLMSTTTSNSTITLPVSSTTASGSSSRPSSASSTSTSLTSVSSATMPSQSQSGSSVYPSTLSSALSTSSATSTVSLSSAAPTFACPANDGQIVADQNGVPYTIGCSRDTNGALLAVTQATSSFDDCFYACDAWAGCQGFTYSGSANGTGAGPCYLKNNDPAFTGTSSSLVSVLRYTGPYTPSPSPSRTTTTTTTNSTNSILTPATSSTSTSATSLFSSSPPSPVSTSTTSSPSSSTTSRVSTSTTSLLLSSATSPVSTFATGSFSTSTTSSFSNSVSSSFLSSTTSSLSIFAPSSSVPSSSSTILSTGSSTLSSLVLVTATSTAGFTCPEYNGQTISDSYGVAYLIGCSNDTNTGAVNAVSADTFNGCFDACSSGQYGPCTGFAYVVSSKYCYLKDHSNMFFLSGTADIVGAINALYYETDTQPPSSVSVRSQTRSSTSVGASSTSSPSILQTSTSTTGSTSSSRTSTAAVTTSPAQSPSPSMVGVSSMLQSTSTTTSSTTTLSSSAALGASTTLTPLTSTLVTGSSSTSFNMVTTLVLNSVPPASSLPFSNGAWSSSGTVTLIASTSIVTQARTSTSATQTNSYVLTSSATFSATSQIGSSSAPPPCPSASCGVQPSNITCSSPYGNQFSVACGKANRGTISIRAAQPSVNECLKLCDSTTGCVAVNYFGATAECDLFSSVNGTVDALASEAAQRPANVTTTYTAFPSSTIASTGSPYSSTIAMMTSISGMSSATSGTSLAAPGSSSPAPSRSSDPTSLPNQSSVNLMPSSATSSIQSTASSTQTAVSSAGPVSAAHTTQSTNYGSSTATASEGQSIGTATGVAITRYTPLSSMSMAYTATSPASMSPAPTSAIVLCPAYNNQNYTDSQGGTYNVSCDTSLNGTVLAGSNYRARQVTTEPTAQSCMAQCDANPACVAVTVTSLQCTLFSSVSGTRYSAGSQALLRVASSPVTVVTVSVCAARTRTTTVFAATTAYCDSMAICSRGELMDGGAFLF